MIRGLGRLLSTKLFHTRPSRQSCRFTQVSCPYSLLQHRPAVHIIDRPSSGIIPLPKIGLRASTSLFTTPAERTAARQGLDSLNEKAALPRGTSQQLEKTLLDLKNMLQPETLTEL